MNIRFLATLLLGVITPLLGHAQSVATVLNSGVLEPQAVAVDADNNLYITDSGNNRVVRFFPDTGVLVNFAGFSGGAGADDGRGVLARFDSPSGIVLARGGLVVADSANHTLRFISLEGVVSTLAGQAGVPGFVDSTANGRAARFRFPSGLAVDAVGNIYIADTKNNAIRRLALDGSVTTLAGQTNGLYEPTGVAAWTNNALLIADTRYHSVKYLSPSGQVSLLAGLNSRFVSGNDDSLFATNASFSNPRSILWLGNEAGIVVSDSGNHTLRRIYYNDEIQGYSVETFAGSPGLSGSANGLLRDARLNSPAGLVSDSANTGFFIADLANNSIRRVQRSPILPQVASPKIGWVEFIFNENTGRTESKLRTVTSEVFNNDVPIAILGEAQTTTRFTSAATSTNILARDIPPDPSKLSSEAPPYRDGLLISEAEPFYIRPDPAGPDVTVKSVGTHSERRSSPIVSARFQFKVANPAIQGDNPAQFKVSSITTGARLFYTIDGSDPLEDLGIAPESDGSVRLKVTDKDIVFKVRAFRANYATSQIVSNIFYVTNYLPNLMALGFASTPTNRVEGSSSFKASPGQRFFAPVTLNLLPNQSVYSLQFGVSVTNLGSAPAMDGNRIGFDSMLQRIVPGNPPIFFPITPSMASDGAGASSSLSSSLLTNAVLRHLSVGWFERFGGKVLYDSSSQDLISFSKIYENVFRKTDRRVVLGAFSFDVPVSAAPGDIFQIDLSRPSATTANSDGASSDTFIDLPQRGSLGIGTINSKKHVSVDSTDVRSYVVGDISPVLWLNAGDFGDGALVNQDVFQIFNAVSYRVNEPPSGSDLFDAMDTCCLTTPGRLGSFSTADSPVGLIAQDLNQDGFVDLITASSSDDVLNVRLGLGDGSFARGTSYSVGVGNFTPSNLHFSDLNGDGKQDAIIAGQANGFLSILYANGNGAFSSAFSIASGGGSSGVPSGVAAADVNLDGFVDLLISHLETGSVFVQTNDHSGSYFVQGNYLSGSGIRSGPSSMVSLDYNSDGRPDVAVANRFDGTISILTSAGTGSLTKAGDFNVGGSSQSVPIDLILSDLVGDGVSDAVTANAGNNTVTIIPRTGAGFGVPASFSVSGIPTSITSPDLNGDNRADLVVALRSINSIEIFLNQGNGTFRSNGLISVGLNPSRVVAADFNGDGFQDVSVSNFSDHSLSIFLGNGLGNLSSPSVFGSEIINGSRKTEIDKVKFGDGILDVNDIYVAFRRSLDPSLVWYKRSWSNGARVAVATPNVARGGSPLLPASIERATLGAQGASWIETNVPESARVFIPRSSALAGEVVSIPIKVKVNGASPARLALVSVDVVPKGNAPPLLEQVKLFPDPALGPAALSSTPSMLQASFATLNENSEGVTGDALLGKLRIVVPPSAVPGDAYELRLSSVSLSGAGLDLFPVLAHDGYLAIGDRSISSLGDGIPDAWRIQHFGDLSAIGTGAEDDTDRDGASNLDEYLAGTNPLDKNSSIRVTLTLAGGGKPTPHLKWLSVLGKDYVIEASSSVVQPKWTQIGGNYQGSGNEVSVTLPDIASTYQFYRVRVLNR